MWPVFFPYTGHHPQHASFGAPVNTRRMLSIAAAVTAGAILAAVTAVTIIIENWPGLP